VNASETRSGDTRGSRRLAAPADAAFLLNVDLVSEQQLRELEARIGRMNPLARLQRSTWSGVPLDAILDLGAFDLARALRLEPQLLVDSAHEHDSRVRSVSLQRSGVVNERALNRWLYALVQAKGADLYRLEGILDVGGARRRFVLQGVHMLLDGRPGAAWRPDEERCNHLVFIGKNLDPEELARDFEACLEVARGDRHHRPSTGGDGTPPAWRRPLSGILLEASR